MYSFITQSLTDHQTPATADKPAASKTKTGRVSKTTKAPAAKKAAPKKAAPKKAAPKKEEKEKAAAA